MAGFIAFGLLLAGAAADAGLRGAQTGPSMFDNLFSKSDSSDNAAAADPMDSYIKASSSDSAGSVWFAKSDSDKKKSDSIFDHAAPSVLDDRSPFDHSSSWADSIFKTSAHSSDADSIFKTSSHSSDSDSIFKTSSHSSDMESIFKTGSHSSDMDSIFKSSSHADSDKPSRNSLAADEDMFPAKKEAPVAVAMPRSPVADTPSNGEGAVVDIKLDSELQEEMSLVQSSKKGRRTGSAPDVEAAVASQRLQDVYIHDQFSTAAAADAQKEQEVNANKDMKA